MYALNVKTTVNASKAALPYLARERGRPDRLCRRSGGAESRRRLGPDAASKAGVLRFTESLAEEFKPQGIDRQRRAAIDH